jgi:DeoR/GlpR family transcriptional regulator of sugar metabolism
MPGNLYPEERRRSILELVLESGRVSVADLALRHQVSEVTIRGDLQALAERNLVVRTHGGAVPAGSRVLPGLDLLALDLRRRRQVADKSRIGQAAAALVADGDAIFLDSSSTSLAIAHHLKCARHVTAVTNSLAVAQELLDAPGVSVVMTGGSLQRETASLIGVNGLEVVAGFNIRRGFFGAHGITPADGLTDVSADIAAVKRPFVALCRTVIAVLDATKWGRVGIASFAALPDVDMVLTTAGAPAPLVEAVRAAGVDVEVV